MTVAENKVLVICRVRPLLKSGLPSDCITINDSTTISVMNHRDPSKQIQYSFDACYGAKATQEQIYKSQVADLVQTVFNGHSATIFCYGVTGAGKTFTIQGDDAHLGIIPRALNQIFNRKKRAGGLFEIKMSYYEVFKENIYDLLRETDSGPGLPIREDANRKTYVAGLKEDLLSTFEEFKTTYAIAVKRRRTASTKLNINSSRSHAVLVIKLNMSTGSNGVVTHGQLNLIDLAGSEDNRKTDNNRERMKESTAINQSLFVLGKVIEALNSGAKRIPYRDSKMTRILQNSLGGESKSMMIVNIAPEETFLPDTHKTLNYATKTKEVVNKEQKIDNSANAFAYSSYNSTRPPSFGSRNSNSHSNSNLNETGGMKRKRTSQDDLISAGMDAQSRKKYSPNQNISNFNKSQSAAENGLGLNRNRPTIRRTETGKRPELYNRHNITNIKNDVESIVVKKIQNFEKKTEDMSHMISERLNRLEEKLNAEDSFGKSAVLDSDILDLISPTTKLKTSKALLVKGKELERSGTIQEALKRYEQALHYAPELKQLSKHIEKLRKKLANDKSNSNQNSTLQQQQQPNDSELPVNVLLSTHSTGYLFSPTNQKFNKYNDISSKNIDRSRASNDLKSHLAIKSNKLALQQQSWKVVASATKKQRKLNMLNINRSLAFSPFKTSLGSIENNALKPLPGFENPFLIQSDNLPTAKKAIKRKISNSKKSHSIDSETEDDSKIQNKPKKPKSSKLSQHYDSDDTFHPSSPLNSPCTKKHNPTTDGTQPAKLNSPTNATILWSINNGNIKSLVKLKGVGKKRAELICEFIAEHGSISNVYELTKAGLTNSVLTNILSSSI